MRNSIGNILNTEYMNSIALMGAEETNDLYGALERMQPIERRIYTNKFFNTVPASQGSRAEFEKHFVELPQHIKDQLLAQQLRLADTIIYAVKPVEGTVIKMFQEQDMIQTNVSNIRNSRLPRNMALLLSGIYVLQGQAVTPTLDDIMRINFSSISAVPALTNGEFTFRSNKQHLISMHANMKFAYNASWCTPVGYLKLDNPRLIPDDTIIELEIEIGTMRNMPANTYLYAGLHGTATIP